MALDGEGLKIAYVGKPNYIYVSNVPKGTGLQVNVKLESDLAWRYM